MGILFFGIPQAHAVVGKGEEFDRFTREALERFQEEQLAEEAAAKKVKTPEQTEGERKKAMTAQLMIEEKKAALKNVSGAEKKALKKELEQYQKELLQFPKKDRFRWGGDFNTTYDDNPARTNIHREKGDTTFQFNPFAQFDLGGRKTDLRFELRGGKQWHIKKPEQDLYNVEGNLRFGRKILPKTLLSLNDRLSRESTRTVNMDDPRIRWDNVHRAAFNYAFSPKLSINFETDYSRRDFPHENFDQDSDYQFRMDPNLFFQATPKSRYSLGYRFGISRIKTEVSDTNSHDIRIGYFGKITGKSSLSSDLAYSIQTPVSAQASQTNQLVSSLGYIWQMTPKTSFRALFSRSLQNAVSDTVSSGELIQTKSHFTSNTLSLSVRFRVHRKVSTEFSFDGSHIKTKTVKTASDTARTQQITFPFQVAIDINVNRWMQLRLTYTYRHRIGDEMKTDEFRSHTWFAGTNVSF